MKILNGTALIISLGLALSWLVSDEAENLVIASWLQSEPLPIDDGQAIIWGFDAPLDKNALNWGRSYLSAIAEAQNDPDFCVQGSNKTSPLDAYSQDQLDIMLPFESWPHYIKAKHAEKLHSVLAERYALFLAMPAADTADKLIQSSLCTPTANVRRLDAQRAWLLSCLNTNILSCLQDDINRNRQSLVHSRTLIEKMITTASISNDLNLYYYLKRQHKIQGHLSFAPLSSAERDLRPAYKMEFQLNYQLIGELHQNRDQFFALAGEVDHMPSILQRTLSQLLFKPNMSANRLYQRFAPLMQEHKLNSDDYFALLTAQGTQAYTPPRRRIKNYLGDILMDIASPNYDEHRLAVLYLEAQWRLIRWQLGEIAQPQFHGQATYIENEMACFKAPIRLLERRRCIKQNSH